jgi:hypothetical protein
VAPGVNSLGFHTLLWTSHIGNVAFVPKTSQHSGFWDPTKPPDRFLGLHPPCDAPDGLGQVSPAAVGGRAQVPEHVALGFGAAGGQVGVGHV